MRSFLALTAILGGALMCTSTNVFAIPSPPQVFMRAPDNNVVVPVNRPSFSASAVDQGNDVQDVLSQIASRLNQGLPDRWERLMHAPITQGSSTIDMIAPSDLESIVRSWGLDNDLFEQAYHDINTLIRLAVGEGVYIAQGFSYNWSHCQGGGEHPACLSTLIVVVRVPYVPEWESYPSHVSKLLLDFLRFASASSYLKIPVYKKPLSPPSLSPSPCPHRHSVLHHYQQQQLQLQDASTDTVAPLAMDPSFVALMESIKLFAETWEKLAKAMGSTISTTIKRRVCLGFDALDYRATSSVMQGVAQKNLAELVEDVVDLEELPRREDIKRLMTGVKYSTNFTWLAESMTFTNPAGESSYFFFAKYGGDGSTDMANVVYSAIKSKFVLAPDMLIVRRQKSSWFGFRKSDETSIEYVPHTLTMNDTLVLEMFWEMVAFHQLAISLGGDPPMYPDLSGYCDRSIP
ncbi:hypothetical protein BGZ52_008388 [Haplosporangium bisporale]|nr:hypothetical protein BGZ52_008388 [Haplosporangium bisporale]